MIHFRTLYSKLEDKQCLTIIGTEGVGVEAARTWREGLFIDLNSTEPGTKQSIAGSFPGDSYVDGAILGAIKGEGAATPLALAGSRSGEALEAFQEVGFRASVTSPQVGAASALKLCRSVFMKGLECLFVETLLAARQFDLQQPVLETIEQTLRAYGLIPMADMLVTTHAVHCGRRSRERDGAVSMLQEMGLPCAMSEASRSFLDGSSRSGRIIKFSSQAGKTGGLLIGARSRRGQSSRRQYFQAGIAGGLRQPGIVDDHPGDRFQRQR